MNEQRSHESENRNPPRLSSEVRNQLGQRLRAVYASLMRQPVPERFIRLLEELEATEKTS